MQGCGVFGGDIILKTLIQWCAATTANKTLHYHSFSDTRCEPILHLISAVSKCQGQGQPVTVGHLYQLINMWVKQHDFNARKGKVGFALFIFQHLEFNGEEKH